jgi:hypothetical protein
MLLVFSAWTNTFLKKYPYLIKNYKKGTTKYYQNKKSLNTNLARHILLLKVLF